MGSQKDAENEIISSEQSYIYDLELWSNIFRNKVIKSTSMNIKKEYSLCEKIFINLHRILALHKRIFTDISKGETDLYECYAKEINGFKEYYEYSDNMPQVDYTIQFEINTNRRFEMALKDFLVESNTVDLGYTHFIFRPIQKIVRYNALFSALIKKEKDEGKKARITEFFGKFIIILAEIDTRYKNSKNYFRIYQIAKNMKNSAYFTPYMALDLISRNRKIFKEGTVVIKTQTITEAKLKHIIIFDHIILICDLLLQDSIEKFQVCDVIVPLNYEPVNLDVEDFEYKYVIEFTSNRGKPISETGQKEISMEGILECNRVAGVNLKEKIEKNILKFGKTKSSLIESKGSISKNAVPTLIDENRHQNSEITFYFKDKSIRNIWTDAIGHMKEEINSRMSKNIKIKWVEKISDEPIITACQGYKPYCIDADTNTEKSFVGPVTYNNPIFSYNSFFTKKIKLLEADSRNYQLMLFITDKGILVKSSDGIRNIHPKKVDKVVYDPDLNLLMYRSMDSIYIAPFDHTKTEIEPILLQKNIENFFYFKTSLFSYIGVINNSTVYYDSVRLFSIEKNITDLRIVIYRRLYISSCINDIKFLDGEIVISTKDFDTVNLDYLDTKKILNPVNIFLEYHFSLCEDIIYPQTILKIEKGLYLLCYNVVGFFIDASGYVVRNEITFLWYGKPLDFKIIDDFFIVRSENYLMIYSLGTGKLLFYDNSNHYGFISGRNGNLLHFGGDIYQLCLDSEKNPAVCDQ